MFMCMCLHDDVCVCVSVYMSVHVHMCVREWVLWCGVCVCVCAGSQLQILLLKVLSALLSSYRFSHCLELADWAMLADQPGKDHGTQSSASQC